MDFRPDANTSYVAEFELIENYLLINKGIGAESVQPSSGMFDAIFGNIEVSASAMDGYEFSHWSDPYDLISELNESVADLNVSKIDEFAEITANFRLITYQLDDINISSSIGGNYILENPDSGNFQHFGQYSLLGVPNVGYKFDRWRGDQNTTNLSNGPSSFNNILNINGPIQLEALFVPTEYELITTSTPTDGGFVSGGGGFSILDSLSVHAEPYPFWSFEKWTGDVQFLVSPESASSSIDWPDGVEPRDLNLTAHFNRNEISVKANYAGNGSLTYSIERDGTTVEFDSNLSSIDSTIYVQDSIWVEAVPAAGWKFNYWTGLPREDTLWSTNNLDNYLEVAYFSPTEDVHLTANLTRQSYELQVLNLSPWGSSSGSGTYEFEELAEISASPNPHFKFSGWSGPGLEFLNHSANLLENTLNIPSQNTEIYAEFNPLVYNLSTISGENGNVHHEATFTGFSHSQNEINASSKVVISPIPDPGYTLNSWIWEKSDGTSGTSYFSTFVIPEMDGNYTVSATFKIPPSDLNFSLQSNNDQAGTIEEIPSLATQVQRTFRANSYDGYSFLGWSTDLPSQFNPFWSSSTIDVNLTNNTSITAFFRKDPVNLNLEYNAEYGFVDINQSAVSSNSFTLEAHPKDNYLFDKWEIQKNYTYHITQGYSSIQQGESRIFIDGNESPELTLIRGFSYNFQIELDATDEFFFSENPTPSQESAYLKGITNNRLVNSSITFDVPLDCPDTLFYHRSKNSFSGNKVKIISIDEVAIIPYPENRVIDVELPASLKVEAQFNPVELNLLKTTNGSGYISTTSAPHYYGDQIEATAIPDEHWTFSHWEGNVAILEPENPSVTIELLKDSQLIANFKKIPYQLKIVSSPENFGDANTKNNIYSYHHGDLVEIKANPREGKYFSHWSSPVLSNRQSLRDSSFTLEGDTTLTANFSSIEYEMSYQVFVVDLDDHILPGEFAGFIAANNSYVDDEMATFKFIINDGYDFVSWRNADDNSSISTDISFTQKINSDLNLNVLIKKQEHLVNLTTIPSDQGFITTNNQDYNGTFSFFVNHGEEVSLFATPKNGYIFQKWVSFGGLLAFPNNRSLSLTVKDDLHIAAYFSPLSDVELKIKIEPEESGWVSGGGTFAYNPTHPITATPFRGWIFDRWAGNDIENELLRSTSINLDGNKTIIAKFKEDPDAGDSTGNNSAIYVLLVSPNDAEFGNVSGSGIYNEKWIDIGASPHQGYEFSHWEGAYIENKFFPNTRAYVDVSKQVIAHFVKKGLFQESENIQDQWWSNPWLGNYWKQTNSNWIFHEKLGWSYLKLENDTSLWLWVEKLEDWFWTTSEIYPYLSSVDTGWYWVNLEKSSTQKLYLYKYSPPEGWLSY